MSAILAINWEFELRGILTVIIGVVALMGSVYLVLGTNLGARLGFLVALAALFGWLSLMGGVWWMYGIGLKGSAAEWAPVEGRTVIQQVELLHEAGVVVDATEMTSADPSVEASEALHGQLTDEGWRTVEASAPEFGQAAAAAGVFLEEVDAFSAGEYQVTNVYEIGGEAYPKMPGIPALDLLAFKHHPRYTLVEVAPYVDLRDEAGRAPITPEVDTTLQRQYVYMIRDLGSLREPAAKICIGSTMVFLTLCWLLHRRDRFVAENLNRKALAAA